jgi:hypothetical protein
MKILGSAGVHSGPAAKIPRRRGAASDLKISRFSDSELDMESNAIVSTATLYSLLQTVHANQLKYDIPELAAILAKIAALPTEIAALRDDFDSKFALLDAKLDQISAQVTPPETGDFNP